MDKLDNDSEATNVEIPKPKAYPDRSSNSPFKNYKEIAEFNTEKSKTKSENMSSQNTSNNETEFSRQAQALRGLAASTPPSRLACCDPLPGAAGIGNARSQCTPGTTVVCPQPLETSFHL